MAEELGMPQRARVIQLKAPLPDGSGEAVWFEIETIYGSLTHRSRDRTWNTAEEARAYGVSQGFDVDPGVEEDW